MWWAPLGWVVLGTFVGWVLGGAPTELNAPFKGEFAIENGGALTPEFLALLIGLTVYTAAFVAEVVRGNALHAKPEQIQAHIAELASSYERPDDVVRWYNGDNQRMAEVEAVVIESNVSDFVLSQAKVVEKTITFEELMGQQA
jgi:hypothetical protein